MSSIFILIFIISLWEIFFLSLTFKIFESFYIIIIFTLTFFTFWCFKCKFFYCFSI